ncbi:MAG: PDZ domain-containing protein [Candidatus Zixiibacteriota bacterium]
MQSGQHGWRRGWPILLAALAIVALVMAYATVSGHAQAADTKWKNERGWLGVYIQTMDQDLAESEGVKDVEGVFVSGVIEDSPADKAGIKKGDVIIRFDGKDTPTTSRLTRLIEWSDPGETKEIVVLRGGKEMPLKVEITANKDREREFEWITEPPDVDMEVPEPPAAPRAFTFSLGQLSTSRIGVALYDLSDQLAEHFGAKDGGALINEVEKDGPADKAGLQAGDVIVEIDHKPVRNTNEVRKAIQKKDDGDIATVMVIRSPSEQKTVDVKVESSDTWSGSGMPRRFHVMPDNATMKLRDAIRAQRSARDEMMQDWRQDFQDQMEELRDQLQALRQELKNLKK